MSPAVCRGLARTLRLLCIPLYPFAALYCVLAVSAEGLMRKGGIEG